MIIGPYLVILRHGNSNVDIYFLFAVSGGFAVVQPDSQLSINAVEAYPLEDFSAEVRRNTSHFPKNNSIADMHIQLAQGKLIRIDEQNPRP